MIKKPNSCKKLSIKSSDLICSGFKAPKATIRLGKLELTSQ